MTKKIASLLVLLWSFSGLFAIADTYVRQPAIDILHYDISVQTNEQSNSITGTTKLRVRIRKQAATDMWLDFEGMTVDRLSTAGRSRPFKQHAGRISFAFDKAYLQDEIVSVEICYHGIPAGGLLFGKNGYGKRVIFAENWPNRAHYWFPAIDHPSDKATVQFSITTADKYEVVANGMLQKTVMLPYKRKLTTWSETKPIPTYCMVFGIAEFAVLRSAKGSLPLFSYVYPQDSDAASKKFRRTAQILDFFENLIGPYPYDKLAQVEANIRLGAMENSDAIFYSESLFRNSSEEPVAHEIAHQWFGNSITESDWDDLWLSEGFATYLAAMFYEQVRGSESMNQTMARYAVNIAAYKPAMVNPVIDPSQVEPMKKLSPITYEKGAWILHMLRGILGDQIFYAGIRRYYEQFAGGTASTLDFKNAMEQVSGIDLTGFFEQWLHKPGWPAYSVRWHWIDTSGTLELSVRQVKTNGLFDMPVEIRVISGNRSEIHKLRIHQASQVFQIPFSVKPTAVEFDFQNRILKAMAP